jgi:recombination protein RecA
MSKDTEATRSKALEIAVSAIIKEYGKGAIINNVTALPGTQFHSTGCYSLDKSLGGGIPKGRIIEIFGPESSGKTTLTLHVVAEVQKAGGTAAFIDMEHALDPFYAAALGVNLEKLLLSQPSCGEEALGIADHLVKSQAVDCIVIDSVAALVPRAELEGDMGDAHMGQQARMMGQAMRKLVAAADKHKVTVIFVNQLRMKLGIMFGNPETTTGGNALKFYASQRLDIRRIGGVKEKDEAGEDDVFIGARTKVKVVKNKIAPPFRECEFTIKYGKGIDKEEDLLDAAVKQNIIEKAGAWYSYNKQNIAQGKQAAVEYLASHPDTRETIIQQLV